MRYKTEGSRSAIVLVLLVWAGGLGFAIAPGDHALAQASVNQADPAAGARAFETCRGCHGVAGVRNAYPSYAVPKLGGQHAEYIISALKAYRRGTRDHSTMQAQASSLSDQEIRDIAAYLASQSDR